MDNFEDIPLNPLQSSLLENASLAQELNNRQTKILQEKILDNERSIKEYQKEILALEQEVKQLQLQLTQAVSLSQNYEKVVNQIVATFNISPPYQVTFIYDKGKPIGIRLPKRPAMTISEPAVLTIPNNPAT